MDLDLFMILYEGQSNVNQPILYNIHQVIRARQLLDDLIVKLWFSISGPDEIDMAEAFMADFMQIRIRQTGVQQFHIFHGGPPIVHAVVEDGRCGDIVQFVVGCATCEVVANVTRDTVIVLRKTTATYALTVVDDLANRYTVGRVLRNKWQDVLFIHESWICVSIVSFNSTVLTISKSSEW